MCCYPTAGYFYPRSPCGERHRVQDVLEAAGTFLSTLSLRRATCRQVRALNIMLYFYPRSPCGERHCDWVNVRGTDGFLSTLSLRRATIHDFTALYNIFISIHALLAESDETIAAEVGGSDHFYPRSPCGERQFLRRHKRRTK